MSRLKKKGNARSNSITESDSDHEINEKNSKVSKEEKGPQRVEKSFHITSMGENVEEVIKQKTVCEDGVQILHSSEVKMNVKQQEKVKLDGPLQMAPDPNKNSFEKNVVQETSFQPQRFWEPEQSVNHSNQNSVANSWPIHNQGFVLGANSYAMPYERFPVPSRGNESHPHAPQNKKCVEKTSYHFSSVGEEGEEVIEESTVCEDGFKIFHSSAYKKKMKRLEKLKQKNVEDLESMKRKIATRFLLTKAKPSMSEEAVERYILLHFDVDEVYVRKNQMKFDNYSSFIFIINSDNELDIDEFEGHQWPGLLKCFFAPNKKNSRY